MRPTTNYATAAGPIGVTSSANPHAPISSANPFYAPSTLPFQAPPFDKIQDSDYQPAIEAGMAHQLAEIRSIAENPEPPTFENTLVTLERSGRLLDRVMSVFYAVTSANTNPELQRVQQIEAPKLAAHSDAIFLDSRLFQRVEAIYKERDALKLDAESLRLVEFYHREFVHAGANLSGHRQNRTQKDERTDLHPGERLQNHAPGGNPGSCFPHRRQDQAGGIERGAISRGCASCGAKENRKAGCCPCKTPPSSLTLPI